jgi:glycosyltransferase involved in cell wall biosynthesis
MKKQLISIVIPAFNEEAIIEKSLLTIHEYLQLNLKLYNWEMIVVDDGSSDRTFELAAHCKTHISYLKIIRHHVNLNLGNALKTGFSQSNGDYIITYDMDLSYSPEHIGRLLESITSTKSDIVVASPYMRGGKVKNVPFIRKTLSRCANIFMGFFSPYKISTYTSMVRVYNSDFIKTLNLKSSGYAINPEIIQKAFILRARVIEIPATLNWEFQNSVGKQRISGLKLVGGVINGLMSGFIFRPYKFFFSIGVILLLFFSYVTAWIFIHIYDIYADVVVNAGYFDDRFSNAVAEVFVKRPHSFLIGGFLFVSAVQFLSIGFLSLQKKRYFDELFHINTAILKKQSELKLK